MKECKSCNIVKNLSEFHNQSKSKDGKQARCKVCNTAQRKVYYKTAHGKSKNDTSGKRYAIQNRKRVYEYLLEHSCIDCGESDPVVLEFDHRDRLLKVAAISTLMDFSWQKILAEINKCDVRCANCHKRRTAEQFGWRKLAWQGSVC